MSATSSSSMPRQGLSIPSSSSSGVPNFPIDPESPFFVAKAILASATAGATTGATLGVIRSANPFAFSINMGINGGVFGLTFFGLREYLISPLLLFYGPTTSHARRLAQLSTSGLSEKQRGKLPYSPWLDTAPTVSELRTERFLDSSISGGFAGGLLSGGLRGIRTVIPAAITSGLIALAGQSVVNEIRIGRLKLLARRVGDMGETDPRGPGIASLEGTRVASAGEGQGQSAAEALHHPTAPTTAESLPGKIMSGMSRFLPVRKLSDEEYLATLEKKRAELDKRLGEIEAEEVKLFEGSQRISPSNGSGA